MIFQAPFRRMLLPLLLVVLGGRLAAQPVGGYAEAALRRTPLAKEIGLGGAFDPFGADASAIFSNAAALAGIEHPSVTAAISTLPFQQRLAALGAGYGVEGLAGFGLSILRYGQNGIRGTRSDGQATGSFDYQDLAIGLGGGLAIGPGAVGATVRYLREDYTSFDAGSTGYSLDLSGTLRLRSLYFSLSLNNVAGEMRASYAGGPRETLPWNARLGALYLHPISEETDRARVDPTGFALVSRVRPTSYWLLSAEVQSALGDSTPRLSVAGEIKPLEEIPFGLRVGLNTLGDVAAGFSYAISTEFTPELRLDYAVRRDYELGDITHHVTLTASFP
jgi:hypothetical protein